MFNTFSFLIPFGALVIPSKFLYLQVVDELISYFDLS